MEKINIAYLLKECPTGMELDCVMYDNLYFDYIREHVIYPIVCYTVDSKGEKHGVSFNWYGKHTPIDTAKCVIFPKGKTTWEGFIPPCKFKDGDIIYTKHKLGTEFVSIFRVEYERDICIYWNMNLSTNKLIGYLHDGKAFKVFIEKDKVKEQRFATEEEKQKLFKAFNDNGYTWNAETKTLEKLIQPKFKVWDRIRHKDDKTVITITGIKDDYYFIQFYNIRRNDYQNEKVLFKDQDKYKLYELVPNKFDISKLKPFDKVLVRDNINEKWNIHLFSYIDDAKMFKTIMGTYIQCIPYEGNEHLLGTADDCADYFKTWE